MILDLLLGFSGFVLMNKMKMKRKRRRKEEYEEMLKRLSVGGARLDIVDMYHLMVVFLKKSNG